MQYELPFDNKKTVYLDDIACKYLGVTNDEQVLLQNQESGATVIVGSQELVQKYLTGDLKLAVTVRHMRVHGDEHGAAVRADKMSPLGRFNSDRHIAYVTQLNERFSTCGSRAMLQKAIDQIAHERGEQIPPHASTVYRWLGEYRADGIFGLLSRIGNCGGANKSRLPAPVDAIVHQKIEETLDSSHVWTAEAILDSIRAEINIRNKFLTQHDRLTAPSIRTLQRRLASLPQFEVAVARYGIKEAERRFANHGVARRTKRILELVEIDHTPLDILIVDEHGNVIGRPVLTLIIDRYSRVVLGFHLSLDGYGAHSVFSALRHALMPKTYLREGRFAELMLTWPCFGWFERLLMDNGREFHSHALTDALLNLGIVGEFAQSRQPNDKPFVERLLRTINYSFVHQLPGTTFAKYEQRQGVNSEKEAAFTLEELDMALHVWLLQKYHRRPHRGLRNKTPLELWNESAKAFPPKLKCDVDHVDFEFAERKESALQHYGIDLNTFRYTSTELMQLRRMLPANQKVEVKWPRRDVGYIFVWDPLDERPIKAFNTEPEFSGLSLEQAQAVRKRHAQDLPENRAIRASAGATINQMQDDARKAKRLKERKAGSRLAGMNSSSVRAPKRSPSRPGPVPSRQFQVDVDTGHSDDLDVFEMLELETEL